MGGLYTNFIVQKSDYIVIFIIVLLILIVGLQKLKNKKNSHDDFEDPSEDFYIND